MKEFVKSLPLSNGCEVLAFDECGLVAIGKREGRATHPNPNPSANAKPAMLRAEYDFDGEFYRWGGGQRLFLVNRLDSPTSGVVIAARDEAVALAARAAFKNKAVEKEYVAICVGVAAPRGTWVDRLRPHREGRVVRTSSESGGLPAKTDFARLRVAGGLSVLRLMPRTGLTHQLRVQCAKHGLPILGDATYGNFAFNKKFRASSKLNRLFLHCLKTRLSIEIGGRTVEFRAEAPLPDSFEKALSKK